MVRAHIPPAGFDDMAEVLPDPRARHLLVAVVDAIVPADAAASASDAGSLRFLHGILTGDRREWAPRLARVLDLVDATSLGMHGRGFLAVTADERLTVLETLTGDRGYRWLAALVNHGYYADPAAGGNEGAASWRALGWGPPPASGWPHEPGWELDRSAFVRRDQVRPRYDAVVVGSGAGGGVAACQLSESGRSVLVVERGEFPSAGFLAVDHLRNARTDIGFDHRTAPSSEGNPRTLALGASTVELSPTDGRWGNNAMTVGGGTRVYGAQAWRFTPEDFAMATTYGVPDGSDLADWPVTYADMEPYYTRAEWEIGVSGTGAGDSAGGPRSRDYPMPPLPTTRPAQALAVGAQRLGLRTLPVPLFVNSVPRDGRPACVQCSQCVGFACTVEAKNGTHNTVLARAVATGRTHVLASTRVERIVTDGRGRVTGVAIVGEVGGSVWRCTVDAGEVVVAAGAVETARLLLASPSDREPHGLGNNTDQVGRHLQGHVYGGALGIFPDPVNDGVGPGPAIATHDFRHHNPGIIGGGMIANEFVPTPIGTYNYLVGGGALPPHGAAAKAGMRRLISRVQRVIGPVHEVTTAGARVRLDPTVRDRLGVPVAQLSGGLHPEDERTQAFLNDRCAEWLAASGASGIVRMPGRGPDHGPSGGQHQAGSARMGTDPATSVTDPVGRVWGHDNLRIADASLHVTNGGVNPALTIFANAFRVLDHMTG